MIAVLPKLVRLRMHSNGTAASSERKGHKHPSLEKKILIRALLHVVLCLGVSRMVVDSALTMYLHYGYCETRHRQQCRLPRHPQDRYNFDSCWRYTADIRQGV